MSTSRPDRGTTIEERPAGTQWRTLLVMAVVVTIVVGGGWWITRPTTYGGTKVEDMIPTGFADWSAHAEARYQDLVARCEQVVVVGLSMGAFATHKRCDAGPLAKWRRS